MKYTAYNKLYNKDGKQVGRTYKVASSSNKTKLKSRVIKDNSRWNTKVGKKDGYVSKLHIIKTVTTKKRPVHRNNNLLSLWRK